MNFTEVDGLMDLISSMTDVDLAPVRPRSKISAGFPLARKMAV